MENNDTKTKTSEKKISDEIPFILIGYHSSKIPPKEFSVNGSYKHYKKQEIEGDVWAGLYTIPSAQNRYGPHLYAVYIRFDRVKWILTIPEIITDEMEERKGNRIIWTTGNLNPRAFSYTNNTNQTKEWYIGIEWSQHLGNNRGIIEAREGKNDSEYGIETCILPDLLSSEDCAVYTEYLGKFGEIDKYGDYSEKSLTIDEKKKQSKYPKARSLSHYNDNGTWSSEIKECIKHGNKWPLYTKNSGYLAYNFGSGWWLNDQNQKCGTDSTDDMYDFNLSKGFDLPLEKNQKSSLKKRIEISPILIRKKFETPKYFSHYLINKYFCPFYLNIIAKSPIVFETIEEEKSENNFMTK